MRILALSVLLVSPSTVGAQEDFAVPLPWTCEIEQACDRETCIFLPNMPVSALIEAGETQGTLLFHGDPVTWFASRDDAGVEIWGMSPYDRRLALVQEPLAVESRLSFLVFTPEWVGGRGRLSDRFASITCRGER